MVFDFGPNLFPLSLAPFAADVTSTDYGLPMVTQLDISGAITAQNGAGNVIEIGSTAAFGEINIMNGAVLNGNIVSDALIGGAFTRPTITFGKLADVNGQATAADDPLFLLNYAGDISGSTPMDADLIGGITRFNGNVAFQSLDIGTQATMGGTGNVTSQSTVQNQGTIAPGNSIGTLSIIGNLNQAATGAFDIEIVPGGLTPTPGTHNDLVSVSGTATVNGGAVNIDGSGGDPTVASIYTFLSATGGVTVNSAPMYFENLATRRVLGMIGANDLSFLVLRDVPFADIGQTPNQMSFGGYFDAIKLNPDPGIQEIRDQLDLLPTQGDVRNAMNELIGDIYGSLSRLGIQNTNNAFWMLSQQLGGSPLGPGAGSYASVNPSYSAGEVQLAAHSSSFGDTEPIVRGQCDCCPTYDGWVLGYGLGGDASSDGNAIGLEYNVGGTHFGASRWLDDCKRIGLFGAFAHTNADTTMPNQWASVDNVLLGGYLHSDDGSNYYILAGAAAYDEYEASRRINFGTINRTAQSDFDGNQAAAYLERGWDICWSGLQFRPLGALQYVYLHQDGVTETGAGTANLTVAPLDVHSLRGYVGSQIAWDTCTRRGWSLSPRLRAVWVHEFLDTNSLVTSGFGVALPPTFAVRGLDLGRDWALLGAGVTISPRDNMTLQFAYDAQVNSRQTFHIGSASVSWLW